jgi:hypothetical protein
MFIGWVILSTQLGLRFRSIVFSVIWLLLSILFINKLYSITYFPISVFLLYHIIRLVFWGKYNREFIPFIAGRGQLFRRVNNPEKQGGTSKDKRFAKWFIGIGFLLFMVCILMMVETK